MASLDLAPRLGAARARPLLAEPLFTAAAVVIALSMLPVLLASALDPRLFQGEGVWVKPLKFQIALSVYLASLAVFARWLPEGFTRGRPWRVYAGAVVFAVAAEIVWIGGAAAFGTGSHFNVAHPVMGAIYGLMGFFAVLLTSASAVIGVAIARNPETGLDPSVKLSIVLGLVLTFVLTVIVAGTLSAHDGHFVGTPVTGATLPVFGWSGEVGDLRVAHFLATHALHVLPVVGFAVATLLPPRTARLAVVLSAVAFSLAVLATFAGALAGLPLVRIG